MFDTEMDDWYRGELAILRKLYLELNIEEHIIRQFIKQLNEMTKDCSVIEFVAMQARRDRALKPYLEQYNIKQHNINNSSV
jgi:hypothetical protein